MLKFVKFAFFMPYKDDIHNLALTQEDECWGPDPDEEIGIPEEETESLEEEVPEGLDEEEPEEEIE